MNLCFKKLTGKLLSTKKMEQMIEQMQADLQRYHRVEASAELKEYQSLKEKVESADFKQLRKRLVETDYKHTDCYKTLARYKALEKNKTLQLFLKARDSQILVEFLTFRQSEDYIKLTDKKAVRKSPDLKRMAVFEKSKEYKAYKELENSKLPVEFEELKKQVLSQEFQTENAFWANPTRWKTTEESKIEARYNALVADSDIRFFLAQNPAEIARRDAYTQTFSDEITWHKLTDSAWKAGFCYKNKALKTQHSYANEKQAYNGGKNCGNINGTLVLATRKEKQLAPAWDEKRGFFNKEFAYTSDVLQTADAFRQAGGLFMVKARCKGHIHHNISLTAEDKLPVVTLFNYTGCGLRVGQLSKEGVEVGKVKGINVKKFQIYSLVWEKDELVWYVNNVPVFRSNNVPKEELYFMLSSFITGKQKAQEGKLEVEWVRVYTKK